VYRWLAWLLPKPHLSTARKFRIVSKNGSITEPFFYRISEMIVGRNEVGGK
jgi:hypothetical protein